MARAAGVRLTLSARIHSLVTGGLAAQGAKFLTVGLASYVVDVAVFNALAHGPWGGPFDDRAVESKIVSTVVSALVSFFGNRLWTFDHDEHDEPLRQTTAFVLVNLVAWGILLAPLAVSRYALGLDSALADNVSANVVGLGLALVFRFWAYRRWVFQRVPAGPGGPG